MRKPPDGYKRLLLDGRLVDGSVDVAPTDVPDLEVWMPADFDPSTDVPPDDQGWEPLIEALAAVLVSTCTQTVPTDTQEPRQAEA